MRSHLMRILALGVVTSLFISGCMLTRGVDRSFFGISVTHPKYENRKITGLILFPFSIALDIVTFPVQVVLVVIFGDDYPFEKTTYEANVLKDNPEFQKLSDERKTLAMAEFKGLLRSGAVSRNSAFVLRADGHWVVVKINDEQRSQLLARLLPATYPALALCHEARPSLPI